MLRQELTSFRWLRPGLALAGLITTGAFAGDAPPAPRRELPKARIVQEPEAPSRIVVKFRDAVAARALAGGVRSGAGAALDAIARLRQRYGATFMPLLTAAPERLEAIERRAATASGVDQPDLRGIFVAEITRGSRREFAQRLNDLDLVEFVVFRPTEPAPPPCLDIAPTTPSYAGLQGYLGPNPGINMIAARAFGNARGLGVRIADCEYGFQTGHEDLCGVQLETGQTVHPQVAVNGWHEHGTAVLGELVGAENTYGCTGLVPHAQARLFPEWTLEEGVRRASAIAAAMDSTDAGDIILLEMQTIMFGTDFGPAELDPVVWLLTRTATDAGIIVVAAAGNGNQDLDAPVYEEYRARGDSGAIIVGAGSADLQHVRLPYSTHGNRVNLQGWGGSVFTLGYGAFAQHGGDHNQSYTAGFDGTSAAAPFVAAACAAIQGLVIEHCQPRLRPDVMRTLLVETGVDPPGGSGQIGPLPDVAAAAAALGIDGPGSCVCPADIDGNEEVGLGDLLSVFSWWGDCPTGSPCPADITGNGDVGLSDLLAILNAWGPC